MGADAASCGTCVAEAPAGGACASNDDCQLGLVCATARICAAPVEMGGACDDRRPCRAALACRNGACGRCGAAGDPCASEDACDAAHGIVCNMSARTCQTIRVAAGGEACGAAAMGRRCLEPAACVDGLCRLRSAGACR